MGQGIVKYKLSQHSGVCRLGEADKCVNKDLSNIAFDMADGCNSSNAVWGEYLKRNGFVRVEPDYPMDVYKFCCNFPHGTYVLGLDGHVVTVVDGKYWDTWDSGGKNVIYFWERG